MTVLRAPLTECRVENREEKKRNEIREASRRRMGYI